MSSYLDDLASRVEQGAVTLSQVDRYEIRFLLRLIREAPGECLAAGACGEVDEPEALCLWCRWEALRDNGPGEESSDAP